MCFNKKQQKKKVYKAKTDSDYCHRHTVEEQYQISEKSKKRRKLVIDLSWMKHTQNTLWDLKKKRSLQPFLSTLDQTFVRNSVNWHLYVIISWISSQQVLYNSEKDWKATCCKSFWMNFIHEKTKNIRMGINGILVTQ